MKRFTALLLMICMLALCFDGITLVSAAIISNETKIFTDDFSGDLSSWIAAASSNPAIDKNIPETLGGSNTTNVLWVWGNASFGYNLPEPVNAGKVICSFDVDPNKMANYAGENAERAFSVYVGGENLTGTNVSGITSISSKIGAMRIFKPANSTDAEFRRGWENDFSGTGTVAITEAGYHHFEISVDMDSRRVNTYLDGEPWGEGYTMPQSFTSVNSLMFTNYLNLAAVFVDNVEIRHVTTINTENLVKDVRWDFIVDEEDFIEQPNTGASIDGVTDGILKLSASDVDPYIRLNYMKNDYGISIKPGTGHKFMKIRLKNNSTSDESTMMLVPEMADGSTDYMGKPASDWENSYTIKFYPSKNDTEFKEYTIPLALPADGKPMEYGSVFRFDYMNGVTSGSMEVDYIVFTANATPPEDGRVTGVCFDSNDESLSSVVVEDFASNKEYYEIDVYRDVYERLSEETVNLTFNSALAEPTVSVTLKDLVTKKCVDIVVSDIENGYLRNYRIVCRAIARPAKATGIVIEEYEIKDKVLTFSGYLTNGEKQPISLLAYKVGDALSPANLKILKVFTPGEDGDFEGIIGIYDDETLPQYYTMELCFDVAGEDEPVIKTGVYFNTAKKNASVAEMKQGADGILEFMTTEENLPIYKNLGLWADEYSGSAEKVDMNEATKKYQMEVSSCEEAVVVANGSIAVFLSNNYTTSEIKTLFERIDSEVTVLEVEGQRFNKLSESGKEWIADNFIENRPDTDYTDWKDFYDAIRKSMLLEKINRSKYTDLCGILLDNTDIIGNELTNLKNTKDTDVIDAAMRILVQQAEKTKYTTMSGLILAVGNALESAKNSIGQSGGAGGGSGGAGGGGSLGGGSSAASGTVTESFNSSPYMDPLYSPKALFSDLDGYEWAEAAIVKLNEMGIVNGVSADLFEPGRAVNREEFVKLICEAFNFGKTSAKEVFSDVDKDAWYAEYVSLASELDIINGISNTEFGSGMQITREDMAVVLFRALVAKGKVLSLDGHEFSDYRDISDYAKNAVEQLSAAEIINGTGDNMFAPKSFAKRAEVAVMILRCIEKFSF